LLITGIVGNKEFTGFQEFSAPLSRYNWRYYQPDESLWIKRDFR